MRKSQSTGNYDTSYRQNRPLFYVLRGCRRSHMSMGESADFKETAATGAGKAIKVCVCQSQCSIHQIKRSAFVYS